MTERRSVELQTPAGAARQTRTAPITRAGGIGSLLQFTFARPSGNDSFHHLTHHRRSSSIMPDFIERMGPIDSHGMPFVIEQGEPAAAEVPPDAESSSGGALST